MADSSDFVSRRGFIQSSALAAGGSLAFSYSEPKAQRAKTPAPKKIALVTTAYYYLSHAYHICGRFLYGYNLDGNLHKPPFALAGMHVEQVKGNDLSHDIAKTHGIPLFDTPEGALTLGGNRLAVDAVLLIGEHGDYPYNAKGQKLYPRYELFQKIVKVFKASQKAVPVFCDKHLSYDRRHAFEMVETSRRLGFPLMAGSSLPVTWRRPEVDIPLGAKIEEAVVVSRGELEIYGIHSLEALQCMVERRTKGQQGVAAVSFLEGDAVWKALDKGTISQDLVQSALNRSPSRNVGDPKTNCRHFSPPQGRPSYLKGPMAFLIEYRDGLKATVLVLNGHADDTTFAARLKDDQEPLSTLFYLPAPPGAAFLEALTRKIEDFYTTGKPYCPVERTLLTGGILDWVLESRLKNGKRLETPDLDIRYDPPADSTFVRGDYVVR